MEAHLRREQRHQIKSKMMFDGDLVIGYSERSAYYRNEPVAFAKKEFDIIELLSMNIGQVFDKERYAKVQCYRKRAVH